MLDPLPPLLVARVALVAAYAWQEGSRQPIRAGEERKKTWLEFFLKPLEICDINGRS